MKIDRELSKLDRFVLDFTGELDDLNVEYVIVSDYVAVLTGRSRATEDIDVIIEKMSQKKINKFVEDLSEAGYWSINAEGSEIFKMFSEGLSPRFAEKG